VFAQSPRNGRLCEEKVVEIFVELIGAAGIDRSDKSKTFEEIHQTLPKGGVLEGGDTPGVSFTNNDWLCATATNNVFASSGADA
jgi:hypothetical protein